MSAVATKMGLIWIVECGFFYTLLLPTVSASTDSVKKMYQLKKQCGTSKLSVINSRSYYSLQMEHSLMNLFILIVMTKIK